jgi:hypothetical protein
MSFPENVTALTFVFEHDPFGEPGTRVSGSRIWKRSILQRFASQRKPAFGGGHYSSGRIFRTCTTRKLDDARLAMPAFFRQQTRNASTRRPRHFQKISFIHKSLAPGLTVADQHK